ncbi:hypothetical protein PV325_007295 [Microctonus aethiopoides]|uniref:Protein RFT1 homolog n=1 Tax=Microctonus aethiopoides TaxID=144406 RepID=A0AA39C6R3_9HYME|nr:hypothetical protein PV325_007295 [Microctonus aethiopoides]KAK0158935.1 hypothetical protein PV328_009870 [Microctonus aethiopoides]
MARNILKSSLENASFNIVFQIFCRGITFLLNAFVIRHVGEEVLGVMNVRLLLLESMILFLSREPFFKACLTNSVNHNWAQVINLLWLTIPICVFISTLFTYIWLFTLTTTEQLPPYYTFAVLAVAISCIIYLLSLNIQLVSSSFLFVKFKIIVDTSTIGFRTVIFILIILHRPENALLAFGIAQLAAMIFHTLAHYIYFYWYIQQLNNKRLKLKKHEENDEMTINSGDNGFPFKSLKEFLPCQLQNKDSHFNENLTVLTWSFFRQSILMQILTEGERIIMTILPILTFAEQGSYDIVNNLGSLAARFIFRPIEDSAYFYFTQTIERDNSLNNQNPEKVRESVNVLKHLLSTVTSVGLVILVFGQSYSSTLLWLYGGAKLTATLPVLLMRAHCLAVLLLGINGVTECYTNATADSKHINKSNFIMIYQSIAFLLASYIFAMWLGPVGFIFGNCVNMSLRIYHSITFINRRHLDNDYKPLSGLVPKPIFSGCLTASAIVTTISQIYLIPDHRFFHVLIGLLMFFIVIIAWIYEHSELVEMGVKKWRERKIQRQQIKID